MDFLFNKDQELIRKSVREFLIKECPKDKVRELKEDKKGYDPKTWKKMAQLGYLGLVIPEKYGGTEGELWDLVIFMEEMGKNIFPSPFFPTVVLCSLPILEYGTDDQKEKLLPRIAEKGDIWTYAKTEENALEDASGIQLQATSEGDAFILNGTKHFVSYAVSSKKILVVARTGDKENPEDGITLFMLDTKEEGIRIEPVSTTARDMRCIITFDNVKVPGNKILGEKDKGWEIVEYIEQHAAVFKAAEMYGGAQVALDLTVKYAKERKQFDTIIGSFQAVQFRLVDLLTGVEGLKYLVYNAVWNMCNGNPSKELCSIAKAKANRVYHDVCYHGIVIHGAIGWTEEMDVGLYHLRTRANTYEGGSTDHHKELIVSELEKSEPDFLKLYS